MNRSNIVLIIVLTIIIGFFMYLSSVFKDDSDKSRWQFRYQYDEEDLAYDRDFYIDYLKKDIGSANFTSLEERFSRIDEKKEKSLYLFYNRHFEIDKTETAALYDFVNAGNDALIIANDFNYELFKELRGIRLLREEPYIAITRFDSSVTLRDTVSIRGKLRTPVSIITYGSNAIANSFYVDTANIADDIYGKSAHYSWEDQTPEEYDYEEEEYTYEENEYEYDEETYTYEEEEYLDETVVTKNRQEKDIVYPKAVIEIMGRTKNLGANLLKIKFGAGHIYLHSNPVLFTNIQFDKPEMFHYAEGIFSELDYEHIYWDELSFQFLNAQNEGKGLTDQSYFEYIFKNRALKTAFYFFLIGLMIFLVVGIKRKYNAIEIVDPLTNSSIDFSKTIARLYWLNPNHRKMADQKMKMFLFEVRNRYGLTTHVLDEDFKIRFRAKSGVSEKLINRLFDAYNLARQSPSIHQDVLVQISESIVKIRQEWK